MDSLIISGFKLMGVGMVAVFLFLSLLVSCTLAMSSVLRAISKNAKDHFGTHAGSQGDTSRIAATYESEELDEEVVVAISAAIRRHRSKVENRL